MRSLTLLSASLALAAGGVAAESPAPAASATDPSAISAALNHSPLPRLSLEPPAPADWKDANTAVGAFPRGHADIVAWEALQQSGTAPLPAMHPPMHHHGARP